VNGGQVGVLEEGDEVGLGSLLESSDGGRLEPEIGLEVPVRREENEKRAKRLISVREKRRREEERRWSRRGRGEKRRREKGRTGRSLERASGRGAFG